MNFIKKSLFAFILPFIVIVTAVYAVDTVTLTPTVVTVSPWDTITVSSVLSWATSTVTYQWSIDWTVVTTQTWSTLSLDWATYVTLFPSDATVDAMRTITLTATDTTSSANGSNSLVIEQPLVVTPVTPIVWWSSDRIFWWDNYCGDWVIKSELWEECDDGNGKNWDWCSINCECESWYRCLPNGLNLEVIPETDERHSNNNQPTTEDSSWSEDDWNDDGSDDIPLKDMMKERNRTPLDLGTWTSTMAPLETPSSWADWRLIGVYAETQSTIDISTTLPKRAAGHVAKPSYLPMTWWTATWRPDRVTLS